MVLQRNKTIAVWGWAKANAVVKVNFVNQHITTTADKNGNWKALLKPMKEGGPYLMDISSGNQRIRYEDIMLGEVWVCSGQSNMEFALRNADGYKDEQKVADSVPVRQFLVSQKMSLIKETDVTGEWVKASPGTIGNFTAVGYFFARRLSAKLHVTVGLVHSSWGGTRIEGWISKEAMLQDPDLAKVVNNQPDTWEGISKKIDDELKTYVYKKEVGNYTTQQLAQQPISFFSNWRPGTVGAWKWQGNLAAYRGLGFMQRQIQVGDTRTNMPSSLSLGQTDADLALYINGKLIFQGAPVPGQAFDLPPGTWKAGENSLFIELLSAQKSQSWFGVGINGDAGNVYVKLTDTTIRLADQKWHLMPNLNKPYHIEPVPDNTVTTLYNGMISPLIPLSMAGVLWYQGESNTSNAFQYRTLLPMMVSDWRKNWNVNFPFLLVQLPPFGPKQDSNKGSTWAELREAQAMALKLPNTGMVVTIDLGDPNNLHPPAKKEFGTRLANKALITVYGNKGLSESPLFQSAEFKDGYADISLTQPANALSVKDNTGNIKGFEIAGADHKFYIAQAQIVDNKIKVTSNNVAQPVAVRYAWSDSPVDANLFNKDGLPVGPFRTDTWKGVTEK